MIIKPSYKTVIDFDFRQLEIFCKVVELSSFSKAAEKVFLTQASVSERIANLENLVGTRLLDRLGRQVVPTGAGKLLYGHALRLMEMRLAASQEMHSFLGVKGGQVGIGGSTTPGEYILPGMIGRFKGKYPEISVKLTIADSSEIEKMVLDGDLELGIIGSESSGKNLLYQELCKDELVLVVPSDHKWAQIKEITISDLRKEPFILRETGSGTLRKIEETFNASGFKGSDFLNIVACFGSSTAIKEAIKEGFGVSILSTKVIRTELKAGVLNVVNIKDLYISRSFYIIQDKRRITSPVCNALIDFLLSS